jgi:ABC-2 type transport system permease protein
MTRLRSLVRAALKANFGFAVLSHRLFREKKDIWLAVVAVLAVIGIFPTLYGYLRLIKELYGLLQPLGQEQVILTFSLLAGQFLILLFGLYYVVSAFYFSKDLEMLIPLPLKPFEVMLSKFTVILVNEYLSVLAIVAPVLVYFGILAESGLTYWTNAVVVFFFLPVIPLAVVSLLVVGMMRVVNLGRKKDALIIVGSLILIAAALSLQFFINRSPGSEPDPEAVARFFASPDSLIKRVGAGFPPSVWATKALVGGFSSPGLLNLLIFVGTSLAMFCGILVMAEKLFYRGLIGIGEISGRRKVLSPTQMSRMVSSGRRPVQAILRREWRIMNRTPVFLLNGVLTAVLFPVIFIVMAKAGGGDDTFILMRGFASAKPLSVILAAATFLIICGCLSGTSSSAFSREGGQFWMSKVIPVTPREQVVAKFLHSYVIALLGIGAGSVALLAVFRLKASTLLAALALALIGAVGLTAIGMIIDLARPLLKWTNPQKAIKQNLNVLLAVFADLGILAGLGFFVFFLAKSGVSGSIILFIVSTAVVLLSLFSCLFLLRMADKRYQEIEV